MARFSQSGGGNPDLNLIKTKRWGYPTQNAVAIVPSQSGQAIALKSSGGAQLRWHIRDTGRSVVDYQVNILSIDTNNCDGSFITFNIDPQDIPLPTGYVYSISIESGENAFGGSYVVTDSTINTISVNYPQDMSQYSHDEVTATLGLPSVYSQVQVDSDGVWIKNDNWTEAPYLNNWWNFKKEGSIEFPYNPSNARTGSGEVLQFGNSSAQSIITGPATTGTAQRLVVAGQDGATGSNGEGGDIYLWAGQGGTDNGSGGDIKVDGGYGTGAGEGGTIKIRGGYSQSGTGGFVHIEAGGGGTAGGDIQLTTYNSAPITISGAGGEFLNNSSVPGNQIATLGDIQTNGSWDAAFTDSTGTLAGINHTGHWNRIGNIIFFCVNVTFNGYTNLGTGQYQFNLPFAPRQTFTSRGGTLHNPNTDSKYHIAAIVDTAVSTTIAKLYYSGSTTDLAWKYNTPVGWADNTSHFDISGFYEIAP